ncbi:hypothetical protein GmHk_13G038088 [Glycine max]|nr:hypothetical protein GmHk_13G038088 [Glycine max]
MAKVQGEANVGNIYSSPRFSFQFPFGEFILHFIQEILCIKNHIFDLKKPVSHAWICELLSFSIISQSIDGQQLNFQLSQKRLIKFFSVKEVENLRRSKLFECNLKERRKKSTSN